MGQGAWFGDAAPLAGLLKEAMPPAPSFPLVPDSGDCLLRLLRNGEPVKMSKRSGDFVTLREVVDEVGRDAVRFMMLFRKKYPRWWYDWNLQLTRFTNRIAVYFALMDDRYPSTDEEQAVHLDFPYPDAEHDLSQGLPLVKWLLAIPHYIVLIFLTIGALLAAIFAWFAILFTGRYPPSVFEYIEGVIPPFSLQA